MAIAKKLVVPGLVAFTAVAGLGMGSALNSLQASADTASTTSDSSTATTAASTKTAPDPSKGGHTANGITETVLTGDTLTKATAAAEKAVSGGTVIRAETDAEGAAYEVHMTKSDGSQVTVKLDSSFNVTSTEDGMK